MKLLNPPLQTALVFRLLLLTAPSFAQPGFDWAMRAGSVGTDHGVAVVTDAGGNSYTTGRFTGANVDFDPGPGTALLTSALDDIFVLKLDPAGNFVWVKQMGGANADIPASMAIDPSGNLYITGNFSAAGDFDPGPGVVTLTPNNGPGFTDIFVVSLDASGNYRWGYALGGASSDLGYGIAGQLPADR